MKYMLLMYANESEVPSTPEAQQAAAPAWYALRTEAEAYSCVEIRPLNHMILFFVQSLQHIQQLFLPMPILAERTPVGILPAAYAGTQVWQPSPILIF